MEEELAQNKWFNWGAPPPGKEIGGTAVAYNKFGKGQALYIGVPIFRALPHREWGPERMFRMRRWIPQLMRTLVPTPIAEIRSEPYPDCALDAGRGAEADG